MKRNLFLILAIAYGQMNFAQEALTVEDIHTTIGTNFSINSSNYVDEGASGTNVLWDFSFLTSQGQNMLTLVDPATTPAAAQFSSSNHCLDYGAGLRQYFSVEDEGFFELGQSFPTYNLIYESPVLFIPFPLGLDTTFSNNFTLPYAISGPGGTATGAVTGMREGVVDGYGTLILPWGEVQAYRVYVALEQTESGTFNGEAFSVSRTGNAYYWYSAGYPFPIMINQDIVATDDSTQQTFPEQSIIFLDDFNFLGVGEVEIVTDLKVYPNPASDYLNVSFNKTIAEPLTFSLLDITGTLRKEIRLKPGFDSTGAGIDVSDLPSGYYLLRIENASGVQATKVVVAR